jgi:hypothetical protein
LCVNQLTDNLDWRLTIGGCFLFVGCCCGPLLFQQQPVACGERCVLGSAFGLGCWLVEATSTSRTGRSIFDLLINREGDRLPRAKVFLIFGELAINLETLT